MWVNGFKPHFLSQRQQMHPLPAAAPFQSELAFCDLPYCILQNFYFYFYVIVTDCDLGVVLVRMVCNKPEV